MGQKKSQLRLDALPTYDDESKHLNVVVETPKGSRAKLAYDPDLNALVVKRVLPEGLSFPLDFGFVPSTLEPDGDPVDVLVLLDAVVPSPCVVRCRLIGVIEARESDDAGELVENDRLVAISEHSQLFADVDRLADVPKGVIDQIEQFFISYNEQDGKKFKIVARRGPNVAARVVKRAQYRRTRKEK